MTPSAASFPKCGLLHSRRVGRPALGLLRALNEAPDAGLGETWAALPAALRATPRRDKPDC
jgi:hypothetical protein